jgi:hypothetical protein
MHNFRSFRSLLTLFLVAAPLAGMAQQLKPNELATNVPGATTTAAPPKGFDPLTASDQDLDYFGFPPRPNQITSPKGYASWASAMAASKTRIVPTLQVTNIFHGPAKGKAQVGAPKAGSDTLEFYNWSGYLNNNGATSYGSSSYYFVYADYVVPIAQQAFGACTGSYDYSSTWVGIDGYGSPDVLQAGTESDAYCSGSTKAAYYSPWFEWFPNGETRITNLPIAAGDDYFVEVWDTNSTAGHAYLVNRSTNQSVTINFSAPSGTTLKGNVAEWIVERPLVGGAYATLTNYVADPFWSSYAETNGGTVVEPGSSSSTGIIMLDNNGNAISYPTLLGTTSFLMQDEGSAF